MTDNQIVEYLNSNNYDIRISHNARWIDQKCTPDVLCIVADCIINYIDNNGIDTAFTSKDIWFSEYAIDNVHAIFRKVDVDSNSNMTNSSDNLSNYLPMLAFYRKPKLVDVIFIQSIVAIFWNTFLCANEMRYVS